MRALSFSLLKNISFLNDASLMRFRWDFKELAELEKRRGGFNSKMHVCANKEQSNQKIKIKSLFKGLLNMKEDFKKPLLESKPLKAQKSDQIRSQVITLMRGKNLLQARGCFHRSSLIKKSGLMNEKLKQKGHQDIGLLDGGIQNQVNFLRVLAQEARRS